jgi:tRNA 2-selenouridine synthase
MPVQRISIEEFLALATLNPVFDVRSPGEYTHAQMPGACSLPLFSDEERKVVGTAYKKQGKQKAIKLGLDFFGPKMRTMVEDVEKTIASGKYPENKKILVHCWRGGMRSSSVAWLLDFYGFEVYTLAGGYKAYRNWVIDQFEKNYDINILGGYTGSGKTTILHELISKNQRVINLEKLANHKGSAFGGIGQGEQPTQEMFENLLATALHNNASDYFWLEDESQRIGRIHIPQPFWLQMRTKPVFFIDIPFEERLQYIVQEYGSCNKESMQLSIERIQKRLGPLETKTALASLQNDEIQDCFAILLHYYDKHYTKGLHNRENFESQLNKIPCLHVDSIANAQKLVTCLTVNI